MSNLNEREVLDALHAKYNFQFLTAQINFKNYINNGVGVGEHPGVVAECDNMLQMMQSSLEMKSLIANMRVNLNNEVVLD